MAAKLKKKCKKLTQKPVTKPAIKKVKKGIKARDDTDEMTDLERDVDRGEDEETGVSKRTVKEELEKVDVAEEDTADIYEYGERGILSEEDETEE